MASLSNTTKQVNVDPEFGGNLTYFHVASRQLYSEESIAAKKMKKSDLVSARDYCNAMMKRYINLLDNATYMPSEHVQKEKEYGIQWRTAFKREMIAFADAVHKRMISEDGFDEADDPLLFFF